MFETVCGNPKCPYGKEGKPKKVFTYRDSRTGPLPIKYCSTFCEKEAKYDSKRIRS